MKFELDTIKKVGEYCRKKPALYRHRCSGNNDSRHVAAAQLDEWSAAQVIECWREGRTNRMTPKCETCDGQHTADLLILTDSEKAFNRGIDKLIGVLEDVK